MGKKVRAGVYKILNTANGHFYIGSSSDIARRWKQHMYYLNRGNHSNTHLQRAWDKYGADKFIFSIVELCDKVLMLEREQFYLDTLKPYYNKSLNAKTFMLGLKRPDDFCRNISRMKTGNKYFLGKTHTPEAREKISKAMQGNTRGANRKITPELREKLRKANTGKTHSVETRRKMGTPVVQLSLAGDFIAGYHTMAEAADATGADLKNVSACCRRQRKTHHGYMWTFASEYDNIEQTG